MRLLIAFLLLPIVEIALFIQVGHLIGVLPTIALVILAAVAGVAVMRRQGLAALADAQRSLQELRDPSRPMAHGALVLLAGGLLVLPGFLTDAAGLILLIPAVRAWLIDRVKGRVARHPSAAAAAWTRPRQPVIDAEYVVIDEAPPSPGPRSPSGWTRH